MKALILSGGAGTRLRPFSYSMPKQLVPVANKPVLEHVLDNILDLGITEIGVIVGNRIDEIRSVLGDGSRFGARITYIGQDRPRGLADCVSVARDFLGDDDFVMYLGDNVLPDGVAEIAGEFMSGRPDAQVVVQRVDDPSSFGVVEVEPDGTVRRLVEKPALPVSDLALIGVYFFTPAIHEAVASISPSARGELEITDAVQWLVGTGAKVRASEYDGYWKDTGQIDDVLDCNRELLRRLRPAVDGAVDDHSVLEGPVVVEPGARVVRSTIEGPAIVGAGAAVEDSHVGRYATIGRDCGVRGTRVESSIILEGSTVSYVQAISDSLIGRRVSVVGPGSAGISKYHLVLGDHTQLEVTA